METPVMMMSSAQFVDDDDDEVFDQIVPDAMTAGRVLPPTSSSYRFSHRVRVGYRVLAMFANFKLLYA